jgi:GxxExxY protein
MESDLAHGSDVTRQIIGLAMRVHRRLGPGLLESVYVACLCHELRRSDTPFQRQVRLRVVYDDARLDCGYVADIIVRGSVLLELKSVERVLPLREAQLLTDRRHQTLRPPSQNPCNLCIGSPCDPIRVIRVILPSLSATCGLNPVAGASIFPPCPPR